MGNLQVPKSENGFYHKGIMTGVLAFNYSYELRRGDIQCTGPADKEGVIAFFMAIDPDVEQIVVYVDRKPDERYVYEDGDWSDHRPVTK